MAEHWNIECAYPPDWEYFPDMPVVHWQPGDIWLHDGGLRGIIERVERNGAALEILVWLHGIGGPWHFSPETRYEIVRTSRALR